MNAAPMAASLDWVALTGNFVLVIVLLVAVLWLLRRMQGIKGLQGLRPVARRLSVVEALTVGPRQKLALLRLDDREILVGITPNGFTLLDRLAPTATLALSSLMDPLPAGASPLKPASGAPEHAR
jgi:flagellar protein FliO/FliZ